MNEKCADIHHAAQCGSTAEVKRFLSEGVSIDCRNQNMLTPLMVAACRVDSRMVSYLIQWGADPNLIDSYGRTALIYAIVEDFQSYRTKLSVVHQLLRAGANPNIGIDQPTWLDERKGLVLHEDARGCMGQAAKNGDYEIAELCMKFGAMPLPTNKLVFNSDVPDATKKEFEAMANNPVSLQSLTIKLIRDHVRQDKLPGLPIPPAVLKDCFGLPNTPVENPHVEGDDPWIYASCESQMLMS